jgi:hypothetical protein
MDEIPPSSFQHASGWNPVSFKDLDPGQKHAGVTVVEI